MSPNSVQPQRHDHSPGRKVVELPLDLGEHRIRDLGHARLFSLGMRIVFAPASTASCILSGSPLTFRSIPWTLISPSTTVCSIAILGARRASLNWQGSGLEMGPGRVPPDHSRLAQITRGHMPRGVTAGSRVGRVISCDPE